MIWTEELLRETAPPRISAVPVAPTPIDTFREAITWTAAMGFTAGALARVALGGTIDLHGLLVRALYLPLGAIAAAVIAGVVVNLMVLPALCRIAPGGRLSDAAYRAAGVLSGVAAFAGAVSEFMPAL